jgi:hypothetical protein
MSTHQEALEGDWRRLYVLGELPEPERSRFEEHFFGCPSCSDAVRTSYLLVRGAEATFERKIFAAEPAAAGVRPKVRKESHARLRALRALPYAAILCLSVGAAFQYVALRKAQAPQSFESFNVPAQAKGELYRIALPAAGQFVELDFDLLETAPQYDWEIRLAGSDRALMKGQARPPANAVVLKLLVPVNQLRPNRYEAAISFPSGHKTVYPFEVVQGAE